MLHSSNLPIHIFIWFWCFGLFGPHFEVHFDRLSLYSTTDAHVGFPLSFCRFDFLRFFKSPASYFYSILTLILLQWIYISFSPTPFLSFSILHSLVYSNSLHIPAIIIFHYFPLTYSLSSYSFHSIHNLII